MSCCNLFCPVRLPSLGDLLISEDETEEEWTWERGAGEDLEGVERRETVVGMYRVREDSVFNLKIVILIILGSFDMMKACGFLTARMKK